MKIQYDVWGFHPQQNWVLIENFNSPEEARDFCNLPIASRYSRYEIRKSELVEVIELDPFTYDNQLKREKINLISQCKRVVGEVPEVVKQWLTSDDT